MNPTRLISHSVPVLATVLAAASLYAGSVARLVYDDITGTAVSALTNAASFPDSPTFREQLDDFTLSPAGLPVFGLQSKDNFGSNFGGWVRGYLEAPADGTYHFFISSDDASELRLSTDHTPANQRRIAFETSYGAPLFSGDRLAERRSGPVALVKGQKYYLEALFKQGTGASYLQVGWQRPDGVQEVIPARHLAQHPLDPFLGRTEPNLSPTFNALGANGGDLPPVTSADEGGEVVLELDVIAAQPTTITWRRGGTVIPGENLSFLKLSRVSAALNGQTIQAVVANAYGQLTTASSRLAITPDQTAPTVVSVDHRGNPNALTVVFSEPVSAATATALANYELRPPGGSALPIHSAVLLPDERTVQLAGDFHFAVNRQSLLTVRGIDDQAATPNRLAPNPTTVAVEFQGEFLGPVALDPAHPLQDLAVLENRIARFEATLTGAKPWFYQWSRNGTVLPGATNRVLEVPATATTAGGYQVAVSNEFSVATSATVQLTVSPDLEPARILAIRGLAGVDTVRLTFDEALTVESATNPANYGLGAVPVLGASLSADQRTVTLHTGALQRGQPYLVSLIGLQDISVAGNALTATGSFVAEVDYPGEVLADGPVRYWRFGETTGNTVASLSTGLDAASGTAGTLVNSPELGVAGLVPGVSDDTALRLTAASSQLVTVPNGSDLNANVGPWAKKSFEFWFRAANVPAPDATGLAATAGIWEEGAATRNIAVYLWRDPAKPNPNEAELVFHAFNNASDGPGAPFGLTTQPAVFVQHTITVGQTYHVVAVFDGDNAGLNGHLILYVNGVEVGRVGGVGQIYNHTGDVQIGRGNGIIHTGENGNLGFFDGVLDEYSVYTKALTSERAAAHYQAGLGNTGGSLSALAVASVDTRGNPNLALVTFTKPVAPAGAAAAANYALTTSTGTAIPITSAALLPGDLTVQLTGAFNFQAGASYTLAVKDVADAANPAQGLNPNPTTVPFTFAVNGAVGIGAGSELASRKAFENESVTFRIVASGTGPFRYQWFRNGVALPGEVRSELRVTATAATLGNYTVRVDNDFSQLTTAPANLSLDVDFAPPRVLAIVGVAGTVNQVRLTFDEALDPVTAVNPGTYSLGAIPVLSASLDASGLDLTLRTGPLQNGQNYTLAITGLKDRAAAANTLTTSVPFVAGASYWDEILADAPVRYWRFEETSGVTAATLTANLDAVATAAATYVNAPQLGVPGLVPNLPGDVAVQLSAAASQRLTVPNGSDLNATAGPWAKRTVQFWFRAASVPAPDATGLAAVAGLWEEGGANRSLAIYLWRDPANTNPNEAELVLHALNNVADGPGSPYGPPNDPAVFVQTTVETGQTYQVVGVFDGDPAGLNGNLVLYVNGVEAGRRPGIGQLYNHTADVQIGQGNALTHLGDNGAFAYFDGVIDEVSVFNTALASARVAQLYEIANTAPPGFVGINLAGSELVSREVLAGSPVRFAVAATGAGPYTYQWYRDGVALAGQTASTLEFTATAASAGDYFVTVQNAFSFATSPAATLTVLVESFPPQLVSATALAGSVNEVRLAFLKPVEPGSATNPATFNLGALTITGITLSSDGQNLTLHTGPQQPGDQINVGIVALRDQATPHGTLSTNLVLESRLSFADELLADGPVRYWRFEETAGTNVTSLVSVLDPLSATEGELYDGTALGVPGLVPNQPGATALGFTAASNQRVLVPNGADLNITAGPWTKRTYSLWFKATSLPVGGASPQAPVLWEQGGDNRGLALYLYGTQDTASPTEALLVWNVHNNAADGVTGGWGVALGKPSNAVYVATPVQANTIYHVVAVLDGDSQGTNGTVRLYLNGELAGSAPGAGQVFNHSANIQLGRGAFVRHDGITAGNLHYFDGVIDEAAVYNQVLPAERIAQLHTFGLADPTTPDPGTPPEFTGVEVVGTNLVLTWDGPATLEWAPVLGEAFTAIPAASSPYQVPTTAGPAGFFRLKR